MDFSTWIRAERGRQAELARHLGIKPPQVADWISRDKPVPLAHMAAIEAFSNGAVRRWDLRPTDWHRIWPELVGTEGAPAVIDHEAA